MTPFGQYLGQYNRPVLELPLTQVLRPEIALALQDLMKIYTVGSFLRAWNNPAQQDHIAHLFATAGHAHQAATLCATWAGFGFAALPAQHAVAWMRAD